MKSKHTYVWISFVVLIFGIIFIPKIVEGFKNRTVVKNDRLSAQPLSYLLINGEKKKVPAFTFVNQDSLLISDKDYLGKVFVVEFFFTTCPTICPIMNKNLVEVQEQFKDLEDFGVASFSINPKHDTPIILKEYAEKNEITNLNWHFLTGDLDAVYALANEGFNIFAKENADAPGGFEHSGYFALIDKQGYLRSRKDQFGNPILFYRGTVARSQKTGEHGEEEQISILIEDIKKLLAEE
ncbi:MAG: SCO family protein [Flavobacteriaceae bacterium]|nr:SCO family protein [Flavobacteriaceae bacterium]